MLPPVNNYESTIDVDILAAILVEKIGLGLRSDHHDSGIVPRVFVVST